MSTASTVTSAGVLVAAHRVRSATASVVVALVIGWIALQAFELRPGLRASMEEPPAPSAEVDRVVGQQEADGLTCRVAPALTDTVVVSLAGDAGVRVLSFDRAIEALRDGSGSIQRYCL